MKTASLGELEKEIMDIVWECKQCTVRDILNKLGQEKKLAYNTVGTVLQRLLDKGLLTRKAINTGFIYSPKLTKEKYTQTVAQSFLKNFIDSFGDTAIISFANSVEKLPTKKREYLLKLLEEHEKNK